MSKQFEQQFSLWQLNLKTSISCWQSISLRYALFASKAPFDSQIVDESLNMVNEKVGLSIELARNLSSPHNTDDPLEFYRKTMETINQKASANVDRLTNRTNNA